MVRLFRLIKTASAWSSTLPAESRAISREVLKGKNSGHLWSKTWMCTKVSSPVPAVLKMLCSQLRRASCACYPSTGQEEAGRPSHEDHLPLNTQGRVSLDYTKLCLKETSQTKPTITKKLCKSVTRVLCEPPQWRRKKKATACCSQCTCTANTEITLC